MTRYLYLMILVILLHRMWDLKPFGLLNSDIRLVISVLYLCFGYMYFKNKQFNLFSKQLFPFWMIVIGIILSMIPAYLYYGQSFVQSIITYRTHLLWMCIPVLLKIAPNEKTILKLTINTTLIMLFMHILKRLFPVLFVIDYERINEMVDEDAIKEFLISVPGYTLACIPIFILLGKIRSHFKKDYIYIITVCYLFIFLVQNRSTLFPITLLIIYSLFSLKSKYKKLILIASCIGIPLLIYFTLDIWEELFLETTTQLGDDEYNRNKAFVYYLSPIANPSLLTYILGNGFLSAHASHALELLNEEGIYNSDMGYIGFWNQYGIIPIIAFFWLIIRGLRNRWKSHIIKIWSLFTLSTILTIGYYGVTTTMFSFSLFYYMLMYYERKYILIKKKISLQTLTSKRKKNQITPM